MPTSFANAIPNVLSTLMHFQPKSILDVGCGYGKWGALFREYTDISAAADDPARYKRENWQVQIDAIEGFEEYLTPAHRWNYNTIHVGMAQDVIKTLGTYDFIFMGDVLEHFDRDEGLSLLKELYNHAEKGVLISTPYYDMPQDAMTGNELERHKSHWIRSDFNIFPNVVVRRVDWVLLLACMVKPGVPMPSLKPQVLLGDYAGADRYTYLLTHPGVTWRKIRRRVFGKV